MNASAARVPRWWPVLSPAAGLYTRAGPDIRTDATSHGHKAASPGARTDPSLQFLSHRYRVANTPTDHRSRGGRLGAPTRPVSRLGQGVPVGGTQGQDRYVCQPLIG